MDITILIRQQVPELYELLSEDQVNFMVEEFIKLHKDSKLLVANYKLPVIKQVVKVIKANIKVEKPKKVPEDRVCSKCGLFKVKSKFWKNNSMCNACNYKLYQRKSAIKRLYKRGGKPRSERVYLTKEEKQAKRKAYAKRYRERLKALKPPKEPKPIKIKPIKPKRPKLTEEQIRTNRNAYRRRIRKERPELVKKDRDKYLARKKNDPVWRIRKNLRKRLKKVLKVTDKIGSYIEMIGCTANQLKAHIEAQFQLGMTWDNYGTVWHIDHIRPVCSFDVTDNEQRLLVNNYKNLQPLFAEDNIAKGSKWSDDR